MQRYPLALLAILATAGRAGVPRDRVLLYLWPESDTTRARNSLNQTLYALRRDLQDADLVLGARSGHLLLRPDRISCDLWDFEAALETGALEEAVVRCTGRFLDGFTLPNLPEFEEWIEEQRMQVVQRYAEALEALALRASERGIHAAAVEYWRRLVWQSPLSARNARGYMEALVAAGDRAAALDYARRYEGLVQSELGTVPDAAVTEYVGRLREEPAPRPDRPPQGDRRALPRSSRPVGPLASEHEVTELPAPPPVRAARYRNTRTLAALLGLTLLIAAGAWWAVRPGRRAGPPPAATTVAVFPFAVSGGANVRYLRTAAADLLASGLDGAGPIRISDPRAAAAAAGEAGEAIGPDRATAVARRLGAGRYVLGDLVENGGRIRVGAAVYDAVSGGEALARASVEGDAGRLFELTDAVALQLIAQQQRDPGERIARAAAATTGSLTALKAFLRGERDYGDGRYASAVEEFGAATDADSAFALAHYRLAIVADRAGRDSLAAAAIDRARRYGARLSELDRRLIEAYAAGRAGATGSAERLYREIVADHPGELEGWFQLGETVFHGNPLQGRSAVEARPAFAEVVVLDSANAEALIHLARIAALVQDGGEARRLVGWILATVPRSEVLRRAFRGFVLGDRPAGERAANDLLARPPDIRPEDALGIAVRAGDLPGTERFGRRLADAESRDVRAFGHRLLAQVAVAQGRWGTTTAELDSARRLDPGPVLPLRSLLAVLPILSVPRAELAALRRDLERWAPSTEEYGDSSRQTAYAGLYPRVRLYRIGLLSARLDDSTTALRFAAALERSDTAGDARRLGRTMGRSIRAWVAWQARRPAEVLAQLDAAHWERGASVLMAEALDRYLRAEALHALGRDDEALGWYASIAERAAYELPYLGPAALRQAEIYDARGDRGRAAEHYGRFLELWNRADPELRPIVDGARRRLERLEQGRG